MKISSEIDFFNLWPFGRLPKNAKEGCKTYFAGLQIVLRIPRVPNCLESWKRQGKKLAPNIGLTFEPHVPFVNSCVAMSASHGKCLLLGQGVRLRDNTCDFKKAILRKVLRRVLGKGLQKGSGEGFAEGFWGRVCRRVLRRGHVVGFPVKKGIGKVRGRKGREREKGGQGWGVEGRVSSVEPSEMSVHTRSSHTLSEGAHETQNVLKPNLSVYPVSKVPVHLLLAFNN